MSSGDARTDRMLDRLLDLFERADPFFATTSDAEREQFDALRRPITKLPIIFERDRKYPTLYGDGTTDHERLFPFGELGSIAESPAPITRRRLRRQQVDLVAEVEGAVRRAAVEDERLHVEAEARRQRGGEVRADDEEPALVGDAGGARRAEPDNIV